MQYIVYKPIFLSRTASSGLAMYQIFPEKPLNMLFSKFCLSLIKKIIIKKNKNKKKLNVLIGKVKVAESSGSLETNFQ